MFEYVIQVPTRKVKKSETRSPLPAGTIITDDHGVEYTIQDNSVSYGGSSIVYKVSRSGSLRNLVMKECYPISDGFFFKRHHGIVQAENEESATYLSKIKRKMLLENKMGQLISNKTGRAIASWENLNVEKIFFDGQSYDAKEGCFIIMEQASDDKQRGWFLEDLLKECAEPVCKERPLRNGGYPSPYVTTCIIEELLKSLSEVHRANYIHGDIQDGNFFLLGHSLENGDIGVGMLLDFGSARKLYDGQTDGITDRDIFTTEGYTSPEILKKNDGILRLTPATDIFSVGALMLYLIKGMRYKRVCGKKLSENFYMSIPLTDGELKKRGYSYNAAVLVTKILTKALKRNPKERYKNAQEMLNDIIVLKKIVVPPKFLLAQNLSKTPYFVEGSRDEELAYLRRKIESENVLWIWGLGGVGKTELAMECGRREIEKGRRAYLVNFAGTIRETVMQMNFSGWSVDFRNSEDPKTAEYLVRLDLLKENYEDALLIVDNFDSEEKTLAELQSEPAYKDLTSLNMKILFTTRSRPDNVTPELKPLNEESCLSLFKSIAEVSHEDEVIVKKLIRTVDFHPMTVEILAHTLNESWRTLSPKKLLELLKNDDLNSADLPDVSYRKVKSEREAKIYGHLRTLFNFINFDEQYREIFCHTTLLPTDGMDAAEFLSCEESSKKKQLKKIEGLGWVRRRRENNSLWIHPLIRNVAIKELKPTDSDCTTFLKNLWKKIDDGYPINELLIKQRAKIFFRAAEELGDSTGNYYSWACHCYLQIKNFEVAYVCGKRAIELQEKILPKFDSNLARTYLETGVAKLSMKWFSKLSTAAKLIFNACVIFQKIAPKSDDMARALSKWSLIHEKKKIYEPAIDLAEQSLEIFKIHPKKNSFEIACVHSDLGRFFTQTKNYEAALNHLREASLILNALTPSGSVDLGISYRNIAEFYQTVEDFENALLYAEKSVTILENIVPKNLPEVAQSYSLIAKIHSAMWEKFGDVNHLHQSIAISRLSIQLKNSEMLRLSIYLAENAEDVNESVKRYRNAADSCRIIKNYPDAEKYISMSINTISFDKTDPDEIFLTYFVASQIYTDEKKFELALGYAQKSLDYYQENFPNDEMNFLDSHYLNIQTIIKAKSLNENNETN